MTRFSQTAGQLVGVVIAGMIAAAALQAQDAPKSQPLRTPPPDIPKIPYTRYVLPNGMVALLNEDHSSPIVYTTLWYHVGSHNEAPGRTGFAHLFEHMMFEGSENIDAGQPSDHDSVNGWLVQWIDD